MTLTPVGATAGRDPSPEPGRPASELVQVFGRRGSDGHIVALVMAWPQPWFTPFVFEIGFSGVFGIAIDYDPTTDTATEIGFLLGDVTLTAARAQAGAPVAGTLHANADLQATAPPRLAPALARLDRARVLADVRATARTVAHRAR